MAQIERLEVIIDLIDSFSGEIDAILLKLGELESAIEAVDGRNVRIDVDLRDDEQALASLAALKGADILDGGDINLRGAGGGGGSAVAMRTLTQQMERLVNKLDVDVSETMENTARTLDDVSDSGGILDLRMTDLHNALAKAVPLIIVLIGALPALIGGLITLATAAFAAAAALGAITVLGALAAAEARGGGDFGAGFMDILREIRDAFLDAFMPLARRLQPLFEDFTDGIEMFFNELANRGQVLMNLADDVRSFGAFILDFVPPAIAELGRFADAFSGVFGRIAGVIESMDLLEAMAAFMADAAPALIRFARQVAQMIPPILELSIGFLQVTNIVLTLINVLLDFLSALQALGVPVGALIAGFLAAITVGLTLKFVIGGLGTAVMALGSGMIFLARVMNAAGIATGATTAIINFMTASVWRLAAAVAVATAGVSVLIGLTATMASKWLTTGDRIAKATEELRKFDDMQSRFGDNPFAEPELSGRGISGTGGSRPVDVTVEGATSKENTADAVWRMKQTNK